MGKVSFDDDKTVPGLQAADMIAWNTRRDMSDLHLPDEYVHKIVFDGLQRLPGSYAREEIQEEGLAALNNAINVFLENLGLTDDAHEEE